MPQKCSHFVYLLWKYKTGMSMDVSSREPLESQFNDLYRGYFAQIHRYVFRMIGSSEEAEQLAQQTFAGLYSYLTSSPCLHDVKSLLFRIATNASLNYISKNKKDRETLRRMPFVETANDDPLDETILSQRRSTIRRGLAQLRTRDRECILLYAEGLSYKEIANVVGTKPATIGKILLRAIERLARQIHKGEKP